MTDWNIVHIFFFIICLTIIVYENIVKSRYGQYLFKDQVLLLSTFSYLFFLQNYAFVVIIGFCFHCLTPLEIELFELVEIYNSLSVWLVYTFLYNLIFIFFLFLLILLLNFFINWSNKRIVFFLLFLIFLISIIFLILMLLDFLFSSLSSNLFWNNFKSYYLQSKTSLTYDNLLYITDKFDWHKDQTNFFILRFEDLYVYSIKLLSIFFFVCSIYILFFLLNDVNFNYFSNKEISYFFFSVFFTWFNNCLYIFLINYILIFLVGLRVSFKILIETWGFYFFL